jgi:hypothetical protein
MKKDTKKPLLVGLIAVEVASAVLASRDLSRRADSQVRGNKFLWRWFIRVNPGNSFAYWAFARR